MEGLIPFVYRAIVRYRAGTGQAPAAGSWFKESPSFSYMRLPGDSGRLQPSSSETTQLFRLERVLSSSPSPSRMAVSASSTSQLLVSTTTQSLLCRTTSRRFLS